MVTKGLFMPNVVMTTYRFKGVHRHPKAVGNQSYLAYPHSHRFEVTAEITETKEAAPLDANEVADYLRGDGLPVDLGAQLVNDIAQGVITQIIEKYGERWISVEVWEDGEVGARASYVPIDKEKERERAKRRSKKQSG